MHFEIVKLFLFPNSPKPPSKRPAVFSRHLYPHTNITKDPGAWYRLRDDRAAQAKGLIVVGQFLDSTLNMSANNPALIGDSCWLNTASNDMLIQETQSLIKLVTAMSCPVELQHI